ncbi:MAG: HAD-IC family P-type ATPase, partial [Candidatus Methanomethylophilaceae archaeon]|nr:HAD-IC family P-type ATPase [Candidatus Methanomethylophilaceae archaeon]
LEGRYEPKQYEAIDEIRFSSERKFSAAKIVIDGKVHIYYMGALSSLGPHMGDTSRIEELVSNYSSKGLRTVLFAESVSDVELESDSDIPELRPLAVFAIEDEVRPDCRETIDVFLKNNMDLKVISGDDPATVDALFTIANIPGERKIVSGDRLAELGSKRQEASDRLASVKSGVADGKTTPELEAVQEEFRQADKEYVDCILETNIFGRMKPDQKEEVIDTLRANGRYVTMVGDGVNDVKSLKKANVSVALESGSGAARGVADMVLVKDNFSALPKALVEGKRTVSGMRNILKIYISRNLVLAILIAMSLIFLNRAPFNPMQNMYYSLFAVGLSAFFMSFWAKPSDNSELVLPKVLRYALPTAFTISIFGLLIMAVFDYLMLEGIFTFDGYDQYGVEQAASGLVVLFLTFCGIFQLLVVDPHFRIFSIDGEVHKDWKPLALMVLLSVTSLLVYNLDASCTLMSIPAIPFWLQLSMIGLAIVWLFVQHITLKWNKFTFMEDALESWYLKFLNKNLQKENERFKESHSS